MDENNIWNGTYFKDSIIEISAIPEEGYSFAGWGEEVGDDSETVALLLTDSIYLYPKFIKE